MIYNLPASQKSIFDIVLLKVATGFMYTFTVKIVIVTWLETKLEHMA